MPFKDYDLFTLNKWGITGSNIAPAATYVFSRNLRFLKEVKN